eukprot:1215208-Rhodomonas_salina.5
MFALLIVAIRAAGRVPRLPVLLALPLSGFFGKRCWQRHDTLPKPLLHLNRCCKCVQATFLRAFAEVDQTAADTVALLHHCN